MKSHHIKLLLIVTGLTALRRASVGHYLVNADYHIIEKEAHSG
jgi:hypothetical protein